MSDVQLEANWFDNQLCCPKCGGNNLHHNSVTDYYRTEDGATVRVTTVDGNELSSSIMPNKTSGNPSGRRSGIVIDFWCENCHGEINDAAPEYTEYFKLQIRQHKGTTYLDWDF